MLSAHAAHCCRGAGVPHRVQKSKPIIRFLSLQHIKIIQDAWIFLARAQQLVGRCRPYLIIKTAARPCFTCCFVVVVVCSAITNSSSSLVYSYFMVMFGCIKEAPPQGAREHNAAVLRSVCAGEALYEALLVLLTDWWWGPNLCAPLSRMLQGSPGYCPKDCRRVVADDMQPNATNAHSKPMEQGHRDSHLVLQRLCGPQHFVKGFRLVLQSTWPAYGSWRLGCF